VLDRCPLTIMPKKASTSINVRPDELLLILGAQRRHAACLRATSRSADEIEKRIQRLEKHSLRREACAATHHHPLEVQKGNLG